MDTPLEQLGIFTKPADEPRELMLGGLSIATDAVFAFVIISVREI